MTKTSIIAVRIEPEIKEKLDNLYSSFGLTLSDAINMFIHKSLSVGGLPFDLKSDDSEEPAAEEAPVEKKKRFEIAKIRKAVKPIAEEYTVKKMFLFGAKDRGDSKSEKDYDISISAGKSNNALDMDRLAEDLEVALDGSINLVSRKSLKSDSKDGKIKGEVKLYDVRDGQ